MWLTGTVVLLLWFSQTRSPKPLITLGIWVCSFKSATTKYHKAISVVAVRSSNLVPYQHTATCTAIILSSLNPKP